MDNNKVFKMIDGNEYVGYYANYTDVVKRQKQLVKAGHVGLKITVIEKGSE